MNKQLPSLVILITGIGYGGASRQVVLLATRLKDRGWDVRIVSLMPPKAYLEELKAAEIPVTSLEIQNKFPKPGHFIRFIQLIRTWHPQIVHSHMIHANIFARFTRPFTSIPILICSAHNINEKGSKRYGLFREIAYRITDPLCDLTIQVSQAGLERYVRVGTVPMHKIRYIPNGVDTNMFQPNPKVRTLLRGELGIRDDFTWLAVGRFEPQKDYNNMLKAFAQVFYERRKTRLLIAGDGSLRHASEKISQDLGVADRVNFLGIRRDVPYLMNAADAYLMSSAWEGMPYVLLEAHSTGLPVVATDVGGNSEVVINGETGFLVPPKDPDALAKAMLRLMHLSGDVRMEMGKKARIHIENNFSLDKVLELWEDLYMDLFTKKVTNK